MPKSSSIQSSSLTGAHISSWFEHEIMWGCLAGAGVGIGVILNFDVFYNSTITSLYSAIILCSAIGAWFGHIAAAITINQPELKPRRKIQCEELGLAEHKTLKMQIQAQQISVFVSPSPSCAMLSALNEHAGQKIS